MSYILEALKKSQAERELGRVPTLDSVGLFAEDKLEPPRRSWALVSVTLAVTAMLIALYAALRQPPSPPTAGLAPTVGVAAPPPDAALAAVNAGGMAPQSVASPRSVPVPSGPVPINIPAVAATGAPLVEAPPPRGGARPPMTAAAGGVGVPEPVVPVPPDVAAAVAGGSDAAVELELQRQLEAESGTVRDPEEWVDVPPEEPVPTPVPPDLIADIESFKQQRQPPRGPQRGRQDQAKAPPATPPPAPSGAPRLPEDPTTLRLTSAQQANLPAFLMTVHVFEADQSRRFVLINGLKYRGGDKTREGLTVERIVADGAVLSFQGNPFFVHR
ncbi:MAG TPA: general secretion pathway protein GspB [Lamprocystis sp. (in: g-proteobacteria)]|nr:general secretion pathway protein GspB [Lamprocystis sp. (in: g-proteobacteria)]